MLGQDGKLSQIGRMSSGFALNMSKSGIQLSPC